MKRISRKYEQTAEFKARCGLLPFDVAFQVAIEVAATVKATLGAWATGFLRNFRAPRAAEKKPEQFKLNLLPWLEAVSSVA